MDLFTVTTFSITFVQKCMMTHPKEIMRAVAALVLRQGLQVFTREEIRVQIGVSREQWHASYSPTFQGMRKDQPGGAPQVAARFKGVFRQVEHGRHTLTRYGRELLQEIAG
jgi:hypothetical protein